MSRPEEPRDVVLRGLAPEAGPGEVVRWAVAHATLAPSEDNCQPWRFRAVVAGRSAQVDLLLDEDRRLPVVDPDQREAVLACGGALLGLRVALATAWREPVVDVLPDPEEPALLARVSLQGPPVDDDGDPALLRAVPLRRTHRGPFERTDVPGDLLEELAEEARAEGAAAHVVGPGERDELLALTRAAEDELWDDPAFRREAADWARSNSTSRTDGVPGYAQGLGAVASLLQPTLERHAGVAAWSRDTVVRAGAEAALLVVGSVTDDRADLVRAGAGMHRLLLRAQARRVASSYLNSSLHVPRLRRRLGELAGVPRAQVVVRLGYGGLVRPTPRRDLSDVLTVERRSG